MKTLKFNDLYLKLMLLQALVTILFFSCQLNEPALSSEKTITEFSFLSEDNPGLAFDILATITGEEIQCTFPEGTSITALKPTIVHTGNRISPSAGVSTNFTNPVTYTVTAADGTTRPYEVSVSVTPSVLSSAKEMTTFSFLKADNPSLPNDIVGIISGQNISCKIPSGVSVTALKPAILHTGSTVNPASGAVNNFSSNVIYSVVAEDGSSQDYTISVSSIKAGPIVYVAGTQMILGTSHVTLWEDGTGKKLTDGSYNAYTNSLFVTATAAYVLGYQNIGHSYATYWVDNGISVTSKELNAPGNPNNVGAFSIYVSEDNDVYVAGGEYGATVWKNGTPTYLSSVGNARSVFVSGTDVYVAGWVDTATGRNATLWKNGVATTLVDDSPRSEAYGVFVSNNIVYVAGLTYTEIGTQIIKVWKNGTGDIITPGSPGAQVSSIFVSDGIVYLAGGENVGNQWNAKIWKNGIGTVLSTASFSYAQSIYVYNNDVYVAGWIPNGEDRNEATLWKNGIANTLAKDARATHTYAWSVVVR